MDTNFLLWPSPHHRCQLEVRNKAPRCTLAQSQVQSDQRTKLSASTCEALTGQFFKPFLFQPFGWTFFFLHEITNSFKIGSPLSLYTSPSSMVIPCQLVELVSFSVLVYLCRKWLSNISGFDPVLGASWVGGGRGEHQYRGSQRYWSWQQLHTSWTRHCWREKKHKKLNSIKFMRWHERGNPIVAMKASLQGKTNGVLCQVRSKLLMQRPR